MMRDKTLSRTDAGPLDFGSDPLAAKFFSVREHESFYRSLKRVQPRRDFHDTLVPLVEDFLVQLFNRSGEQLVDELLRLGQLATGAAARDGTLLDQARRQYPEVTTLLGVEPPLTFDSLRRAYRRASKRHHPDTGGDHETMIIVNRTYAAVHAMLSAATAAIGQEVGSEDTMLLGGDSHPTTARAYFTVLAILLASIHLDDWNLEESFRWMKWMTGEARDRLDLGPKSSWAPELPPLACLLATRFALAGRTETAIACLTIAREFDWAMACMSIRPYTDIYSAEAAVRGEVRPRVILNHRRQAENALRIGVIDHGKYNTILARLARRAALESAAEEQFGEWLSTTGFIQDLPVDVVARSKATRGRLVPEPSYFVDEIEDLADEQQAEYLGSFGSTPSLALVKKYLNVRLNSLLRSVIVSWEGTDKGVIANELRFLAHVEGADQGAAQQTAVAVDYLAALPHEERHERLKALQWLHAQSPKRGPGLTIVITTGTMRFTDSTFRIATSNAYLEIVRLPLERLRLAVETGSTKTSDEEVRERSTQNEEMDNPYSRQLKKSEKAAFRVLLDAKERPDQVARILGAHCDLLLSLGSKVQRFGELEVGCWINWMTIALVRLTRWTDAAEWLDRFFALPETSQRRSSTSVRVAMRKRLERCRRLAQRGRER